MLAIDTSSLIAYLRGEEGPDVDLVDEALRLGQAVLPPVVLTDTLSIPGLGGEVESLLRAAQLSPSFRAPVALEDDCAPV